MSVIPNQPGTKQAAFVEEETETFWTCGVWVTAVDFAEFLRSVQLRNHATHKRTKRGKQIITACSTSGPGLIVRFESLEVKLLFMLTKKKTVLEIIKISPTNSCAKREKHLQIDRAEIRKYNASANKVSSSSEKTRKQSYRFPWNL